MKTVDHTDALAGALGHALRSLRAIVPYELAALYERRDDRLEARAAEGPLASPAVLRHVLALARRPAVREALDDGRPCSIPMLELYHDHHDVLARSADHACLLIPLRSDELHLGAVVLVSQGDRASSDHTKELVGAYGRALASTLVLARKLEPPSPLGDARRLLPLRVAERLHLLAALEQTGGKIYGRDGAAKLLDLKPTTLQSKLKKHGINRLDVVPERATAGRPSGSGADGSGASEPRQASSAAAE